MLERRADQIGLEHADRLATQTFGHGDVIDAIAFELGRIDVLERERNAVIDVEGALRLADQPEIGVVHEHVDVRQFELRTGGQLFNQELEVVVAGDRDDLRIRVGSPHAERGRHAPAQRTRLAAVDPVARFIHMQELRTGDLRQADVADVARVPAEYGVHFLVHALRLDRFVVEIGLAQHGAFALLALGHPGVARLELAGVAPLPGGFDEQLERRAGVGGDAEIRPEHAADLGRFDVDVDKSAAFGEHFHRTGKPITPAIADAQHEVRRQHGGVAVAVAGLQPGHARHQGVIVGNRAPAHQCRDHRYVDDLGKFDQQRRGVRVHDTATRYDQRTLRGIQHGQRLFDLLERCTGLIHRQRLVHVGIELDLGHLHVVGQVDQHRTGTARTHHMKRLLKHLRHQRRLAHHHRPLGHRLGDRFDIDCLEIFLVQARTRRLAGNAQDRNRVGLRGVQARDHVGAAGSGRADAHADVAGTRTRVALGHVRCTLDVTREHMLDGALGLERGIERIDRGAGYAERLRHAFFLHYPYGGLCCCHLRHAGFLLTERFFSPGSMVVAGHKFDN